jgi:hypothetical protein
MYTIEISGERLQAHGAALRSTLFDLLTRLHARDTGLDPSHLLRVVVNDVPASGPTPPQEGIPPLFRSGDPDAVVLHLAAPFVEQALAGDSDQLLQMVHAMHRELWRARIATDPAPVEAGDGLTARFSPIAALMLDEYRANRNSAWSLPGNADLLLPHLLGLLDELPAAGERALAQCREDGDIERFMGLTIARLTHLMQTAAFCLGYLAGLGRTAADISPELKTVIDASILAGEWPRMAALLAGAAACDGDARALQMDMLRIRILAVLERMGLRTSLDGDGAIRTGLADNPAPAGATRH